VSDKVDDLCSVSYLKLCNTRTDTREVVLESPWTEHSLESKVALSHLLVLQTRATATPVLLQSQCSWTQFQKSTWKYKILHHLYS